MKKFVLLLAMMLITAPAFAAGKYASVDVDKILNGYSKTKTLNANFQKQEADIRVYMLDAQKKVVSAKTDAERKALEDKYGKELQTKMETIQKAKLEALKAKDTQFTKTKNEIKEEEVRLTSYQKSYDTISRYADGRSGKHVISGVTLLTYGDEAVQLLAGNYDEFEILYSSTILITELIKMIKKEGYSRYNFYGITGDFSNDNPLIGLYTFKKSFGGHVVELIGEFEYVISRPMKTLYELGIKCYNAMKKVRD